MDIHDSYCPKKIVTDSEAGGGGGGCCVRTWSGLVGNAAGEHCAEAHHPGELLREIEGGRERDAAAMWPRIHLCSYLPRHVREAPC